MYAGSNQLIPEMLVTTKDDQNISIKNKTSVFANESKSENDSETSMQNTNTTTSCVSNTSNSSSASSSTENPSFANSSN